MSIDEAISQLNTTKNTLTALAREADAALEKFEENNQEVPDEFQDLPDRLDAAADETEALKESLKKLQAEVVNWEALSETVESELQELIDELEAEVQELDEVNCRIEEVVGETGPNLEASLDRAATELHARFQQSLADVNDALARFYEATDELKLTYTERLPETLSNATTQIENVFDNADEFLQTNFIDKVTDSTKQQITETKERISSTVDNLETNFRSLVETTRQQSAELLEKIENFGSQWTGKIDEVKDEYDKVVSQIQAVERDVRILTEAMDDALSTSGVAVNAVSSVLTDVKGIIDSVA